MVGLPSEIPKINEHFSEYPYGPCSTRLPSDALPIPGLHVSIKDRLVDIDGIFAFDVSDTVRVDYLPVLPRRHNVGLHRGR
jgi:hypothetical protein